MRSLRVAGTFAILCLMTLGARASCDVGEFSDDNLHALRQSNRDRLARNADIASEPLTLEQKAKINADKQCGTLYDLMLKEVEKENLCASRARSAETLKNNGCGPSLWQACNDVLYAISHATKDPARTIQGFLSNLGLCSKSLGQHNPEADCRAKHTC